VINPPSQSSEPPSQIVSTSPLKLLTNSTETLVVDITLDKEAASTVVETAAERSEKRDEEDVQKETSVSGAKELSTIENDDATAITSPQISEDEVHKLEANPTIVSVAATTTSPVKNIESIGNAGVDLEADDDSASTKRAKDDEVKAGAAGSNVL
jgi:hypothetical protein